VCSSDLRVRPSEPSRRFSRPSSPCAWRARWASSSPAWAQSTGWTPPLWRDSLPCCPWLPRWATRISRRVSRWSVWSRPRALPPEMPESINCLIERYEGDIEALLESGDADDKIVAGVLADVIGDLKNL